MLSRWTSQKGIAQRLCSPQWDRFVAGRISTSWTPSKLHCLDIVNQESCRNVLLRIGEIRQVVERAFKTTKGNSYKQVKYCGLSTVKANAELKHLKLYPKTRPVFDNRAPLIPIGASAVQERHQVDLVITTGYKKQLHSRTATQNNIQYLSEGTSRIVQTDQGGEFKKEVNACCKQMQIKRIISALYHLQSQGYSRRLTRGWKNKLAFDMRKSNYRFTDWVSRLQTYAQIYNRQHHGSLGTSPCHVYHRRHPCNSNETPTDSNINPSEIPCSISSRLNSASTVRAVAKTVSGQVGATMVQQRCRGIFASISHHVMLLGTRCSWNAGTHNRDFNVVRRTDSVGRLWQAHVRRWNIALESVGFVFRTHTRRAELAMRRRAGVSDPHEASRARNAQKGCTKKNTTSMSVWMRSVSQSCWPALCERNVAWRL